MSNVLNELYLKYPIFRDLIAFNDIGKQIAREISTSSKINRYSMGDYLCRRTIIPSEILLISEGEARLIGDDKGKIITLEKLGPGSFIGLASFLRAAPCEEILAASKLEVISFPDTLILKLLREKKSFFKWCTSTIFTAELADLVSIEFLNSTHEGLSLKALVSRFKSHADLLPYGCKPMSIDKNQQIIVNSQNIPGYPIGTKLSPDDAIPSSSPPLPSRFIVINNIEDPQITNVFDRDRSNNSREKRISTPTRDSVPLATGINLGQSDQKLIQLIRGRGEIQEALAYLHNPDVES